MEKQSKKNGQLSSSKQHMSVLVSRFIDQCIRCNHCMDICPVTKGGFTIDELNSASKQGSLVPDKIKMFAFRCVQCGKCVPVCPVNIRRDYMVRYIKSKIKDKKPWSYTRYLLIKGPNLIGIKGILQKLYIAFNKLTTRDLALFMETTPVKKAEVLFYPGCYIYSKKTVRQTLRLLDRIGCFYTVLGGLTSCCGTPHMLQGEFDQADQYLERLHQKIKTVDPRIIITSCAECFEAVEQIKTVKNETFEVCSVVEYLSRNIDKFPDMKIRGNLMVHDSCRFKKESSQGSAARTTVERFGQLVEQKNTQGSSCCYQWNHGCDPGNTSRQMEYLAGVQKLAPTLACTCLTCYEELKKRRTDVEVIDVIQLYEEALDAKHSKERSQ
jgi:heterodisulfide reductase subunit D